MNIGKRGKRRPETEIEKLDRVSLPPLENAIALIAPRLKYGNVSAQQAATLLGVSWERWRYREGVVKAMATLADRYGVTLIQPTDSFGTAKLIYCPDIMDRINGYQAVEDKGAIALKCKRQMSVLHYFLKHPKEEFTITQLAELMNADRYAIKNKLVTLERNGVLQHETREVVFGANQTIARSCKQVKKDVSFYRLSDGVDISVFKVS